jgi:hypothetical protein
MDARTASTARFASAGFTPVFRTIEAIMVFLVVFGIVTSGVLNGLKQMLRINHAFQHCGLLIPSHPCSFAVDTFWARRPVAEELSLAVDFVGI